MVKQMNNDNIIDILKTVEDRDVPIDIWNLGLIYEIRIEDPLYIKMTFSTPFCPYADEILQEIKDKIKEAYNIETTIEVVFEPQWSFDNLSQDAKFKLDLL